MSRACVTTSTSGNLQCSAADAWEKICFYEHITLQPSWFLRSVLPVPMETTGTYRKAGDISHCVYSDGGFLAKRITRVVTAECIQFEIIEQTIRYSSWIRLKGGTIRVVGRDDGTCTVRMNTRYEMSSLLFSAAGSFVATVVKAMHGIVLRDMRHRLQARATSNRGVPVHRAAVVGRQ
jgi:hypothetical protein